MERFFRRLGELWDERPATAWVLVLCGIGLAIWATYKPQSPGVSIGLLALVAGIMGVRPNMHPAEKLTWVAVLIVFAILEVASIGRSDHESRAVRESQNERFDGIAQGLRDAIQQGRDQFAKDSQHFDEVIRKANSANQLLQESIADITGGKSFGFAFPQPGSNDGSLLRVWNEGDHPLLGVTMTIADTTNDPNWGVAFYKPIYIGNIGPHDSLPVPELFLRPTVEPKSSQAAYWIFISAQNGTVSQSLYFRRNKDGKPGWAYSYLVTKPTRTTQFIHGVKTTVTEMRPIMRRGWSDEALESH